MKIIFACAFLLAVLVQFAPANAGQKAAVSAQQWQVFNPRPDYPYEARLKHISGTGIYVLDLDPRDGHVIRTVAAQSSGHKILDDAAITTFMKWRFKPGCPPRVKVPSTWTIDRR